MVAERDPLKAIAEHVAQFLMEAGVETKVGAKPHGRTTYRNGYRERRWDARPGSLQLSSVVREAVIHGVSTRKVEAVLEAFGVQSMPAGQVSRLCAELGEKVEEFRKRPLGEFPSIWLDAL